MKRVVPWAIFAAMLAGGVAPFFFTLLFRDTARLAAHLERAPDFHTPEYPRFLREVRARTRPGDTIAILVPMRHWNEGYAYAYYRASYILAGRRVLPLVAPDDSLRLANLREARFVAAWQSRQRLPHHEIVWSGDGGVLARSVR